MFIAKSEILNRVTTAKKVAEAALITRREETNLSVIVGEGGLAERMVKLL